MTAQADIARFKIGDRIYTTAALDEISLKDLMLFNSQAADMGLDKTWADVERLGQALAEMTADEAGQHPDALFLTGVTIWASRRAAGDEVTFGEAIDIKLKDLEFLPSTKDHRPNPTKARKGSSTRKGSGPAPGAQLEGGDSTSVTETSEPRSASA